MSHRHYVSTTRSRWKRPSSSKRWYRCFCGRWWGTNKSYGCVCGASKGQTMSEALAAQSAKIRHLQALDWIDPASICDYVFKGAQLRYLP